MSDAYALLVLLVAIVFAGGLALIALMPRRSTRVPLGSLRTDDAFAVSSPTVSSIDSVAAPTVFSPRQTADARAPEIPGSKRDIIAKLESKRGSRVIAIIHRENMERSYLDIVDLEDTLTAIRKTPKNKPLDIILHSPGGHIRTGQQIARAIKAHPAKTTVFVPYYALGSATFPAYAADQIVMSAHAALSPFDPYVGKGTASSILNGIKDKSIAKIEDETVICADIAKRLMDEARRVTCELMDNGKDYEGVCHLSDELVSGKWSSDRAIGLKDATDIGLNVSTDVPPEVYDLVRACRRSRGAEPSVATLDATPATPRLTSKRAVMADGPPTGTFDNSRLVFSERARPLSEKIGQQSRYVWLAQAGSYAPASSADQAKGLIRQIEQQRGSRVICIIHGSNMEREAFHFEDLEDTLGALIASDPSKPLDIVLHTQGGLSFTGRQIARAVKAHRGRKTVFVPYYAMSAGTRVSLAADQIVMGQHATLGPIDTQLYGWPAPSILRLQEVKPADAISDEFLIMAEEARKIMIEGRTTACDLLQGTYSNDGSCAIADELISGRWTHGFGITASTANQLGLNVTTEMPDIFYDLIRCFRHGGGDEPSVLYLGR